MRRGTCTCEQVSDGHPDKLCDQIADAIVTEILRHDRKARAAIECLIKDRTIVLAGEVRSSWEPDYRALVTDVFQRIGWGNLGYDMSDPEVILKIGRQSPDISAGVDRGGAGDQGVMCGYATDETPELLPIPFVLATRFLEELKAYRGTLSWALHEDAKAQVAFDYERERIASFLCSVHHSPEVSAEDIRPIVSGLMHKAALGCGYGQDFRKIVNPAGAFTIGGPFADCGVTGRKLACDTYGGVGCSVSGALSGKDPTKVDRSAAYMARKIACDIVLGGMAHECTVQLAYAIGMREPMSVSVDLHGTGSISPKDAEAFARCAYDLTPEGIIRKLGLLDVDYNLVSAYGHFGKPGLPWEAEE